LHVFLWFVWKAFLRLAEAWWSSFLNPDNPMIIHSLLLSIQLAAKSGTKLSNIISPDAAQTFLTVFPVFCWSRFLRDCADKDSFSQCHSLSRDERVTASRQLRSNRLHRRYDFPAMSEFVSDTNIHGPSTAEEDARLLDLHGRYG
jgi:hypothetical protein